MPRTPPPAPEPRHRIRNAELRQAMIDGRIGASLLIHHAEDVGAGEVGVFVVAPEPITFKGAPIGFGRMELYEYEPEGPVLRLYFEIHDDPQHPLLLDAFLNPSNSDDRAVLARLTEAEHIYMHAFVRAPELPYLGSKQLNWRPQHRQGAFNVLRRTTNTRTQWPAAKERVMREHPIDERAGGDDGSDQAN